VLVRRLFFINSNKTKYVSVGFYPAREFQPLVGFGAIRRRRSKIILFTEKHIYMLAQCLPKMLVSICNGFRAAFFVRCESGAFRLSPPRNYGSARLYFRTQYISLMKIALQYLARMFHVVQQKLSDDALALPDVLSCVASSINSVT